MKKSSWIISAIIGILLGYLIGNLVPLRQPPKKIALESGTYCCDTIDIGQKCIKKTAPCPGDKPITVSIP